MNSPNYVCLNFIGHCHQPAKISLRIREVVELKFYRRQIGRLRPDLALDVHEAQDDEAGQEARQDAVN